MMIFRTHLKAMGGLNEVVAAAPDAAFAQQAMQAAAAEVLRIEAKYSRYRSESILTAINASAGRDKGVACDEETVTLLDCADALYRQSDRMFDITSGVLRHAWNFKKPSLPSQRVLDTLLPLVGWDKVERSNACIRLPSLGMEIDFGGFAKEYAADRAADVLLGKGIAHGYVSLGGDIRAIGPQPDGTPWLIGVQDPRKSSAVLARIEVSTGALATSGDYERFFEIDGQRYCHVLDPRTGFPVDYWASVSVRASTALLAGAFSSIAMLKACAGLSFLRRSNRPFLAVETCGQVHRSELSPVAERVACPPPLSPPAMMQSISI